MSNDDAVSLYDLIAQQDGACKTEFKVLRGECSPTVTPDLRKVKYYLRIPCFLAMLLVRFGCVEVEYNDCEVDND